MENSGGRANGPMDVDESSLLVCWWGNLVFAIRIKRVVSEKIQSREGGRTLVSPAKRMDSCHEWAWEKV